MSFLKELALVCLLGFGTGILIGIMLMWPKMGCTLLFTAFTVVVISMFTPKDPE